MKRLKILAHFGDSEYTPERKKLNEYGGIGYYRTVRPAKEIKDHDVTIVGRELVKFGDSLEEQWDNIFKEFDVFWTSYFSSEVTGTAMLYYAKKNNKMVVIDVDDNYLDIPESNNLYDRFKATKRDRAMLSTILSFTDALTVSTYPLKERLHAHILSIHGIDKPIYVIPNFNDYKEWKAPKHTWSKDKITIGYTGSNSHQDDLKMIMPAMSKLMKKYKNLHFQLIGSIEKEKIPLYFKGFDQDSLDRIGLGPAEAIFKRYPKWLGQQTWDIGIAPLVDTAFTRCKSHIKWMEYSMFKIPTVASKVYPYFMPIKDRQTVEDGKTGLVCRPPEWEGALEKLILDPELRKTLGQNAFEHIKKNWQYKDSNINEIFNKMLSGRV